MGQGCPSACRRLDKQLDRSDGEGEPPSHRTDSFEEEDAGPVQQMEWWSRTQELAERISSRGSALPSVCAPTAQESAAKIGSMIIIDWDDTLLPTSFLKEMPRNSPGLVGKPLDTLPCYESLKDHAGLVKKLLQAASVVAHISIVTLSARPWVKMSSETYLPGLDIESLLRDLDIPVYYATEYLEPAVPLDASIDQTPCLATVSKRNAMTEFMRRLCASKTWAGSRLSVLSIGDSLVEQQALKDCCRRWAGLRPSDRRPLCKTVKLMDKPSLQQLSDELRYVISEVGGMASREEDFDVRVDSSYLTGRMSLAAT